MPLSAKPPRPDLRPILASLLLPLLLGAAAGAEAATPTAEQKALICGARASCKVTRITDAGKDGEGKVLAVVELNLALADRPAEAPEEGCLSNPQSDERDGGIEYWLIRTGDAPQRLMSLCNDGYGAAGVGEDEVTIGDNRLVHEQSGGSAWRWDAAVTYSLSPYRELKERTCSFHTLTPNSGTILDLDMRKLRARALGWAATANAGGGSDQASDEEGGMGCPDWPKSLDRKFLPRPGPDSVAAYVVPAPLGSAADPLAQGTALGDCALELSSDGKNGFLVFGKPAGTGKAADVRVIAQGYNELLLQIYDPTAAKEIDAAQGKSWIHAPHFEIWTATESPDSEAMPATDMFQLGIGLDGQLYQGAGKPTDMPALERWSAMDELGRSVHVMRLHWQDQWAFLAGLGVVYSQSQNGKQARLISTTGIVKNRPLFLPTVWAHQPEETGQGGAHCSVQDKVLMLQP
jgi:hypothetical protein